jgi:HlyD family secretion protein
MKAIQLLKRWKFWVAAGCTAAVILAASLVLPGLSVQSVTAGTSTQTANASTSYQTAQVARADLSLETTGTGTLVAHSTVDLGFMVGGTVSGLTVQVGEAVKTGQVLATLKEINELQQAVVNKTLALKTAQDNLDTILNQGAQALAAAQATQASAEEAYIDAQENYHTKKDPRCSYTETKDYWWEYFDIGLQIRSTTAYLEKDLPQRERNYIQDDLRELQLSQYRAYVNFRYCEGYTENEILSSDANLQLTKANLDVANGTYQSLLINAGVDPTSIEMAQIEVTNARLQLVKAQADLAGATIIAPMDGTVMSVSAQNGDAVGTVTLITLADTTRPVVEVNVDETDLLNFAVGCSASISFDALPERVFSGTITQVYPVVSTTNYVSVLQGVIELDSAKMTLDQALPLNLSGSVDITCQMSQNALLAPVDALHEDAGASPYVYVLNSAGQPEKRTVEVGMRNTLNVEILSGLEEGELVITSGIK